MFLTEDHGPTCQFLFLEQGPLLQIPVSGGRLKISQLVSGKDSPSADWHLTVRFCIPVSPQDLEHCNKINNLQIIPVMLT
jgi:hypothetical protein